jgi:hypothetical protein
MRTNGPEQIIVNHIYAQVSGQTYRAFCEALGGQGSLGRGARREIPIIGGKWEQEH